MKSFDVQNFLILKYDQLSNLFLMIYVPIF